MGYDIFFAILPYGKEWRNQRRTFHKHFSQHVIARYHPIIKRKTNQYLKDILSDPADFIRHTQKCVPLRTLPDVFTDEVPPFSHFDRVIVKSGYGIDVKDHSDSYIAKMQEVSAGFQETGTPGRFLVDLIPAMRYIPRWMPGAGWRRWADYYRNKALEARDEAFDIALNAYVRLCLSSTQRDLLTIYYYLVSIARRTC